jgi:hypothetical protein
MPHYNSCHLAIATVATLALASLIVILPGIIANSSPTEFCIDSSNATQLPQCKNYLQSMKNGALANLTDKDKRNKFLDQNKMNALLGLAASPLLLISAYFAYKHSKMLASSANAQLLQARNKASTSIQLVLFGSVFFFCISAQACIETTDKFCGSEQGAAGLIMCSIFMACNLKTAYEHKPTRQQLTCQN